MRASAGEGRREGRREGERARARARKRWTRVDLLHVLLHAKRERGLANTVAEQKRGEPICFEDQNTRGYSHTDACKDICMFA